MSLVRSLLTLQDYQSVISSNNESKLLVIYFTAAWCGPCKTIKPIYEQLATQHRDIVFAKLDVDANAEATATAGVTSMPTFHFYKGASKIGQVVGANKEALTQIIKEFSAQDTPAQKGAEDVPGQIDLASFVNLSQLDCLNQVSSYSLKSLFDPASKTSLESDVDPQLMLTIPFNQNVKLHSLKILAKDEAKAPKTVKTFINLPSAPSFDDVSAATETLSIVPNALTALKYVRYQNVYQLTLFVEDNHGDAETTLIDRIIIYGTPIDTTQMSEWKSGKEENAA